MQTSLTTCQYLVQEGQNKCEPLLYAKREVVKGPDTSELPAHTFAGTKTFTEVKKENVDAD